MVIKGHLGFLADGAKDPCSPLRLDQRKKEYGCPRFGAAYVGGNVDLTGTEAGWLRCVSDEIERSANPPRTPWWRRTFGQRDQADEQEKVPEWRFDRCKIGQLDFWEPLPRRISMRGLECRHVRLPKDAKREGKMDNDRQWRIDLLKRCAHDPANPEKPATTEPYALMERLLRAEGRVKEANEMFAEIIGGTKGWVFKWLAHPNASSFFLLIGGMFLGLSILVFACETAAPSNWLRPPDAPLFAATEIALPVISLTSWDKSTLDRSAGARLRQAGNTQTAFAGVAIPMTPAYLAGFISFVGWIVWPLFFLTVSGLLRRE
jgi:hypothetical protein